MGRQRSGRKSRRAKITYLLFLKRLDDLHTLEENKAARLKLKDLERRVFPRGEDPKGRPYDDQSDHHYV